MLPLLGLPFEVAAPEVEELDQGDPRELVLANADRKARAVAGSASEAPGATVVIGCDTDVVLDGVVLGKPDSAAAAAERLRSLAGRPHEVLSGVVVLGPAGVSSGVERTVVRLRDLAGAEIDEYVRTDEWQGRAGGYAVQGLGSALIAGIEGDLSNVIGLPLPLVRELLAEQWPDG